MENIADVFSDEPQGLLAHDAKPWARFWGRLVDISGLGLLLALPIGFVAGLLMPEFFTAPAMQGPLGTVFFGMLLLPITLVVDAVVTGLFGATPGQLITGIRVRTKLGGRLSYGAAFKRNAIIYVMGFGLRIPIVNLAMYVASYSRVNEGQLTDWDKRVGTRVVEQGASLGRTTIAAVIVIVLSLTDRLISLL